MNKIITRNHQIFGTVRFTENKPYLQDIVKCLNYRNDSYLSLIDEHISLSENGYYLIDDIGIKLLIDNSNIEMLTSFKEWINWTLESIRKKTDYIYTPIKNTYKVNKQKKVFNKYLKSIKNSDWITIPVHGFSNNYMYDKTYDGHIVKSESYKKWRDNFPVQYLSKLSHIDFSKPIQAVYVFDKKEEFDTPNLSKSLSDIIADYFNVDDHQITNQISIQGEIVDSYADGKIHIYMYNI